MEIRTPLTVEPAVSYMLEAAATSSAAVHMSSALSMASQFTCSSLGVDVHRQVRHQYHVYSVGFLNDIA